jgi:hypothetical protein
LSLYARGKSPLPIGQEAACAPEPVWTLGRIEQYVGISKEG